LTASGRQHALQSFRRSLLAQPNHHAAIDGDLQRRLAENANHVHRHQPGRALRVAPALD